MSDNVEHPSHYKAGGVETIEGIRAALGDAFLDYCRGNVLKYVWRCRHKGKLVEDLRKAAKYLEWAIDAAGSEKPSEPQELAIPEGWRELEENEPLCEDDLFELDGEWVGHEYNPSGGVYSSRIHRRHIRKIETLEPEPLAIPEGWRELNPHDFPRRSDMREVDGSWEYNNTDSDAEYKYWKIRVIRKIEQWPDHVQGVWVEEADANSKKIEPTETFDASIPDPGPGYRLLSKDPPERVVKNDEYLFSNGKWIESESWRAGGVQCSAYYRRKIEPTEWIPKVGDKVRVNRLGRLSDGKAGVIVEGDAGEYTVRISGHNLTSRNLTAKDLELVEAAS